MKQIVLDDIPIEGVSHNPEIPKQVMIRNGEVPHLTTLARARFAPGQVCTAHTHQTMYEIYMVESGRGTIRVNTAEHSLERGVCVVVEPGELHQVSSHGEEDLVLTYFGIAV